MSFSVLFVKDMTFALSGGVFRWRDHFLDAWAVRMILNKLSRVVKGS